MPLCTACGIQTILPGNDSGHNRIKGKKSLTFTVMNPKGKLPQHRDCVAPDHLKRVDEKAVKDRVPVPVVVNSAVIPQLHVHPVAGSQLQDCSVTAAV